MNNIHPTAIISPLAEIGSDVEIGPYCVIEDNVKLGSGCYLDAHVKIARYTTIGNNCRIYYGALIGTEPQDHRFKPGVISFTEIGDNVILREYVTVHRSPFEQQKTIVGANTLLMAFVHVGHDAVIGAYVTVANHTGISGHVVIDDFAVLSGYVLIHQFCRIGRLTMIGGRNIVTQDIPPYCMLAENSCICGPNTVGLRRAGLSAERRAAIRTAIKIFFFKGLNSKNAFAEIAKLDATPEIALFTEFIQNSNRGIMSGDPNMVFRRDVILED